jgi:hypothetical protein
LHNNLLPKSEFGQAHCVEWFKRSLTKFILKFLDTPTSFYKFLKFEIISEIYLNKNEKEKGVNCTWAKSGPWHQPFGEAAHRPLQPHT